MISSLSASLTLNREATQKRAAAVVQNVEPVYYQLQKGEMLVRKGERVSREQQIKLQSLYETASDPVRWNVVAGAFLISSGAVHRLLCGSPAASPARPCAARTCCSLPLC